MSNPSCSIIEFGRQFPSPGTYNNNTLNYKPFHHRFIPFKLRFLKCFPAKSFCRFIYVSITICYDSNLLQPNCRSSSSYTRPQSCTQTCQEIHICVHSGHTFHYLNHGMSAQQHHPKHQHKGFLYMYKTILNIL